MLAIEKPSRRFKALFNKFKSTVGTIPNISIYIYIYIMLSLGGKSIIMLFLVTLCECAKSGTQCPNLKADFRTIRKKRALAFPDGSTFVVSLNI